MNLNAVFLSRETHRNNIGLSRVAKSYALAQNYTNLMDFLLEYYIQFFCLKKPIGITLGCLEWPNPMLLPLNCILIVSMGILHTVFLSRETHRNNIGLSRVAKSYAFATKLY